MHKFLEYICSELEDLEKKADRDGSLTMTEIQYADTLLRMKKNLLKAEEMSGESYSSYGENYNRDYNRDYNARGRGGNARRDSRGRYAEGGYSRANMADAIRDMMDDAPDEQTRKEFQRFIDKLERR